MVWAQWVNQVCDPLIQISRPHSPVLPIVPSQPEPMNRIWIIDPMLPFHRHNFTMQIYNIDKRRSLRAPRQLYMFRFFKAIVDIWNFRISEKGCLFYAGTDRQKPNWKLAKLVQMWKVKVFFVTICSVCDLLIQFFSKNVDMTKFP